MPKQCIEAFIKKWINVYEIYNIMIIINIHYQAGGVKNYCCKTVKIIIISQEGEHIYAGALQQFFKSNNSRGVP